MQTEITATELKTHCAEYLRQADMGNSYIITRSGKPVAELLPIKAGKHNAAIRLKEYLAEHGPLVKDPVSHEELREMIAEGRR